MSEEERSRLITEITFREAQVSEMRSQVQERTSEANRLQQEVEQQRYKHTNNGVKEHNGSDDLTNAHVGKR